HHRVALLDVVLDPLLVDGDVALDEVEARGLGQIAQLVVRQVDAVYLPWPGAQDRIGERAADEAVCPKNHYFQCHTRPSTAGAPPASVQQRPKVKRVMLAFSGTFGRR